MALFAECCACAALANTGESEQLMPWKYHASVTCSHLLAVRLCALPGTYASRVLMRSEGHLRVHKSLKNQTYWPVGQA